MAGSQYGSFPSGVGVDRSRVRGLVVGTLLGPEGAGDRCSSVGQGFLVPVPLTSFLVLGRGGVGFGGGVWGVSGCWLRTAQWTRASSDSVLQGLFVGPHILFPSGGGVCGVCCVQVVKGTRWMPGHQEPMKDVGGCVKPRGAANRALIRGCPNGGTPHQSCGVTRA